MPTYSYILPVIHYAPGDGSGDVFAVQGKDTDVFAVDKAGFDEDGWHGGMAQDAEGGMGFDTAVFVALVKGGEAGYELVLDGLGESSARAVFVVAVGFCAPPAW
ncbi:hypothetical protein SAMN05216582_12050 [Selenomonas ruminantium]|uniref:Uncharacterized protein n=1 Tax=Selenomonas ruminantium TaxID=971 RepID=A0A1M6VSQ0_SELRU|nr:hypothetical protein [Selenomonas ruminantium]SHK84414.1 hypothetical protein SAMN05216582_12050 [Selenomonas ruminantium]